jgi:aerobic-type carbon monoxide dehydrogenase small subunit (CoxS/CutS family)
VDTFSFELDGLPVAVPDEGWSLLEVLRRRCGVRSAKDGCSPQGQCGCCTVWVDGQPRVACVTPARRVAGRAVTTLEGLDPAVRLAWTNACCATGASQCGFCTPGIVMRLAAGGGRQDTAHSLLGHLCRCTGWQTIGEAAALVAAGDAPALADPLAGRDRAAAERRARLEGREQQTVGPHVAAGDGGFADDTAPPDCLVAVRSADGDWVVAESLTAARQAAGTVQGRRTTVPLSWPLEVPDGDWVRTLRTTWVEPAYLEPDASWCAPGGQPASPLANGGAFGGKRHSIVAAAARELADRHGWPVRCVLSREDVVRLGPKRPPIAAGVRADGTGVMVVARTPGIREAIAAVAPGIEVVEIDLPGPPTGDEVRAAGWAEAAILLSAVGRPAAAGGTTEADIAGAPGAPDTPDTPDHADDHVRSPDGAEAWARVAPDGTVHVRVRCGDPLDPVVLRSYTIGAAHMALGWVRSEGIAVGDDGVPLDLTIRSFGVLRATEMPNVAVTIEPDDGPPVNGSDAVFAAVAAAAWRAAGHPDRWPIGRQ